MAIDSKSYTGSTQKAPVRKGRVKRQTQPGSDAAPEGKSPRELALSEIVADPSVQTRAELHEQTVREYAEEMKAGTPFPPVVVFHDGQKHWLADGFHRFKAAQNLGRRTCLAGVKAGGRHEALVYALSANARHGLRRTNADKRRAVELALKDPELARKTGRSLAKLCEVTHPFVEKVRAEVVTVTTSAGRIGAIEKPESVGKAEAPLAKDDNAVESKAIQPPTPNAPRESPTSAVAQVVTPDVIEEAEGIPPSTTPAGPHDGETVTSSPFDGRQEPAEGVIDTESAEPLLSVAADIVTMLVGPTEFNDRLSPGFKLNSTEEPFFTLVDGTQVRESRWVPGVVKLVDVRTDVLSRAERNANAPARLRYSPNDLLLADRLTLMLFQAVNVLMPMRPNVEEANCFEEAITFLRNRVGLATVKPPTIMQASSENDG